MAQLQTDGGRTMGLRERKRRATRAAIERAAIALVGELGYDSVTVALICERADVSQGTFFNYFPTKDAAIVGIGVYDLDVASVHAAFDRLMPCSMFHATLSLFLEVVDSFDWESDVAAQRVALVKDTPALMRLFLDNTFGFVSDFREIVGAYLEANPAVRASFRSTAFGASASPTTFPVRRRASKPRNTMSPHGTVSKCPPAGRRPDTVMRFTPILFIPIPTRPPISGAIIPPDVTSGLSKCPVRGTATGLYCTSAASTRPAVYG